MSSDVSTARPSLIGQRIGVYRIDALLGVGGMGEVYRAQDTKLRRDVAIKVLPAGFAVDADRLARFEREARLLASLNHPHIAAIYGFEDGETAIGSLRALVLELVDGETLAERISRKPIPLAEALDVAHQIAAALDAAHEKGIVHRDLKPSNVKITPAGVVKVLDFGIAKVVDSRDSTDAVGAVAVTELASRTLVVLGTAAYMSPEQARGGRVDKRADIWAFGCVLFELLTGKPAFARETVTDTLVWVVEHDPDWNLLPATVTTSVRDLLRRCLEKDVRRRLRDIGDARCDEAGLAAAASSVGPARRRSPRMNVAWLLAGAVIGAAALGAWSLRTVPEAAPSQPVTVRALTDAIGMEESPALSPDGKTVAFVARADGFPQIWVRLLAGGAPLQITHGALDHREPRWAPDSSSIVYFTAPSVPGELGTVWEVAAFGGEPRRLTTALSAADVSHDGRLLAAVRLGEKGSELVTLSRDGSQTLRVQPLEGVGVYNSLRWSPDGQWLAFQHLGLALNERVMVVPAAGGQPAAVARSSQIRGVAWLGDSSGVVYSSAAGSTVLYPPTRNLRVVGRDGQGDRPLTFGDVSYTQPDVSASGAIVATRIRMQSNVWRFPLDGTPLENTRAAVRITHQTGQAQTASVSPDGAEVAYLSDSGGHGNVWVARTDGTGAHQVTFEQDPSVSIGVPVWSNTGSEIAVIVSRGGTTGLALVKAEGGALREIVPDGVGAAWSVDDRWLYYSAVRNSVRCIEKVPVAGGPAVSVNCDANGYSAARDRSALYLVTYRDVLNAEIRKATPEDGPSTILATVSVDRIPVTPNQLVPTVSPDGTLLAMPLLDGDTSNVWVLPTAGGPMRPVTNFGDHAVLIARRVAWSPDGHSVYASVADIDADVVLLEGLRP